MSGPSEEEWPKVMALKERIVALMEKDSSVSFHITETKYLRFLRGRGGNLDDAYKCLGKHLQWRRDNAVEEFTEQSCPNEIKKRMAYHHGICKHGRPVIYVYVDRHDRLNRDIQEMFRFIVYNLESVLLKANPDEEKLTMVFDLSRFTFRCMDFELVKMLIQVLQQQFPETLSVLLIVDAPWIFYTSWAVIRPWLDPVTASKVEFIQYAKLADFIPPDQYPDDLRERRGNVVPASADIGVSVELPSGAMDGKPQSLSNRTTTDDDSSTP